MNQEKVDEIEKVLRKHFDLTNPYFANIAREICKLFEAQPDESRLLTEQQGMDKGRREVVEFLIQNCHVQNTKETGAWQTKLKEWRIAGE